MGFFSRKKKKKKFKKEQKRNDDGGRLVGTDESVVAATTTTNDEERARERPPSTTTDDGDDAFVGQQATSLNDDDIASRCAEERRAAVADAAAATFSDDDASSRSARSELEQNEKNENENDDDDEVVRVRGASTTVHGVEVSRRRFRAAPIDEDDLRGELSPFGTILSVRVDDDQTAFVAFRTEAEAERAASEYRGPSLRLVRSFSVRRTKHVDRGDADERTTETFSPPPPSSSSSPPSPSSPPPSSSSSPPSLVSLPNVDADTTTTTTTRRSDRPSILHVAVGTNDDDYEAAQERGGPHRVVGLGLGDNEHTRRTKRCDDAVRRALARLRNAESVLRTVSATTTA